MAEGFCGSFEKKKSCDRQGFFHFYTLVIEEIRSEDYSEWWVIPESSLLALESMLLVVGDLFLLLLLL